MDELKRCIKPGLSKSNGRGDEGRGVSKVPLRFCILIMFYFSKHNIGSVCIVNLQDENQSYRNYRNTSVEIRDFPTLMTDQQAGTTVSMPPQPCAPSRELPKPR